MTHERDIDRLLDLWLSDGPSEVADRVILDVAARIDRQPQRPAWRFLRRPTLMNSLVRLAAAIVAVALIGVVGFALLGRPTDFGVGIQPSPATTPTLEASPTLPPTPSSSPASSAAAGAPATMPPGTYVSREFAPALTYTVPAGWFREADNPTSFVLSRGGPENIELVTRVFRPERGENGCMTIRNWERPHAASDLVEYLMTYPAFVTTATPSSVGGLQGWAVDLAVKASWRSACADEAGVPAVFEPIYVVHWYSGAPVTVGMGPGDSDRFLVLDDGSGNTMVIEVRGDDPAFRAATDAILESFDFEHAP